MKKLIILLIIGISLVNANLTFASQPVVEAYYSAGQGVTSEKLLESNKVPFADVNMITVAFVNAVNSDNGASLVFGYNAQITEKIVQDIQARALKGTKVLVSIFSPNGVDINNKTFAQNAANFLLDHHLQGLDLDIESNRETLLDLVKTLYPILHKNHLMLTISVYGDPSSYGLTTSNSESFYKNVDAIEVQNYYNDTTLDQFDATISQWHDLGIPYNKIIGGINTEPGAVQTSLSMIKPWAMYARGYNANGVQTNQHILKGMFSWRLDNDHTSDPSHTDINPTFSGANALKHDMSAVVKS